MFNVKQRNLTGKLVGHYDSKNKKVIKSAGNIVLTHAQISTIYKNDICL